MFVTIVYVIYTNIACMYDTIIYARSTQPQFPFSIHHNKLFDLASQ